MITKTIKSIKELEEIKDKLQKIKIYVCLTATGKTYLCNNNNRFFDLDTYGCDLKHKGVENYESITIEKMYEELDNGKIILNAAHSWFMNYLDKNKLPFVYIYPTADCEDEYLERMKKRGSSEEFIAKYGRIVSKLYPQHINENRPTYKIEITKGEYASDYILKIFDKQEL